MKLLGLIGGTGWISTAEYYRLINELVNKNLSQEKAPCQHKATILMNKTP